MNRSQNTVWPSKSVPSLIPSQYINIHTPKTMLMTPRMAVKMPTIVTPAGRLIAVSDMFPPQGKWHGLLDCAASMVETRTPSVAAARRTLSGP